MTDVIMPQMSGLFVAKRVRDIWHAPECSSCRVMPTSQSQPFSMSLEPPSFKSPFLPYELSRHLRDLLDRSI